MREMCRLIWLALIGSFRLRTSLEAENLIRWKRKTWSWGNRSMCFAGERPSDRTSTILFVFYLFGSIAGFRPSLRWLRLSGRSCRVSGVLALAIPQPCWQTEGLG